MEANNLKSRTKANDIHAITAELAMLVGRLGAITTDLMSGRRKGEVRPDQRLTILHACEPGKAHNRSYTIDARGHAEAVLKNREGISAADASQVWGLMRDLSERMPHSRICVLPDPDDHSKLLADGTVGTASGKMLPPNQYLASRVAIFSQCVPDAVAIRFKRIHSDRQRNYVEVLDAEGGMMLCTDATAINDMLRRLAMAMDDDESKHLIHRRHAWLASLGVAEATLFPALDVLGTLLRVGPVDTCYLREHGGSR
nr:hypothetical protein [Stenotrophomonas pavanii]